MPKAMRAVGKITGATAVTIRSNNSNGEDQKRIAFKGTIEYSDEAMLFLAQNTDCSIVMDVSPSQREMFGEDAETRAERSAQRRLGENGEDDDEEEEAPKPRRHRSRRSAQAPN